MNMAHSPDETRDVTAPSLATPQSYLRTLLAARLAVVSFFMGLVVFFQSKYGDLAGESAASVTIVAAYLLSIIYAISLRFVKNSRTFVFIQLYLDLLLITSIIFCTGGVNSPFALLYILVIFASSILLSRMAVYIMATFSSVSYCMLLLLEYYKVFEPYYTFPPVYDVSEFEFVFMRGVINTAVFYLVAYLSGHMAKMLLSKDAQLIQQDKDFTLLKAFHENVLENMGSGFLAIDLSGKVLSSNPAATQILGIDSSDIINAETDTTLQLPRLARFFKHLHSMDGHTRQFDWVYTKKDGTEISLTMSVSKFIVGGKLHGAVAAFHDISNLKKMEKQVSEAERLASLGRVAAGIAHEIRNPLASLSGSIQMLRSDISSKLESSDKRLMDIIIREAERLNSIITEFLNFASKETMFLANVDLGNLISETLLLLKSNPEYREKLEIEENIENDLVAYVDHEKTRQIIWNLLINSADSMENGGTIYVEAVKASNPNDRRQAPRKWGKKTDAHMDHVRITIRDTGKGIEPEHIERIFEPFFTTKRTGTGLGLPIVHKIVKSHSGEINVTSTVGKGTAFTIWLPLGAPILLPAEDD
ncbi:hypothetical protein MNBD_NITROSPINAE01-1698 [hydrothermal vent metagenome]|uniref:Histidine kinase n=1 Tax=hydrothermal vent metagenome TaxID=652676 RepID=A0A3B1BKJ2_9ZZZZ